MILGDREALITMMRDKILNTTYRCPWCTGGCSVCEFTGEVSGWHIVENQGWTLGKLLARIPWDNPITGWVDFYNEHYGISRNELLATEVPGQNKSWGGRYEI
jgi:hypothetical protein